MKFTNALTIRPLGPADAENFMKVHHAAVHGTANADYPPDILDSWSGPVNADRIAKYMNTADEEVRIGAFDGDTMAGLGAIVPKLGELRACYVHPDYGRMGVGGKLVEALEHIATGMGLPSLSLDSSITAEKFYAALGYQVVERGSHRLEDGTHIASIKMRKQLTPIGDIATLKARNAKVEADKAWETSWTRRVIIATITYIIVAAWLAMLGVNNHMLHALVPVAGYLLSMVTLPFLKAHWIERVYQRKPRS